MSIQDRYDLHNLGSPWYVGNRSFMRAKNVPPTEVPDGWIAVAGVPIDSFATTVGATGMRFGPGAVRQASLYSTGYFGIQSDVGLATFDEGVVRSWPEQLQLVDTGDTPILPNNTEAQIDAIEEHIYQASRTSSLTVSIGGDHFAAYPIFRGFLRAQQAHNPDVRVAYLHIDSHTDFVDFHHQTGRMHHGSCTRRISELAGVEKMAWYGINATTQPNQLSTMHDRGFKVATASYIRREGVPYVLDQALDYLLEDTDVLYVSIDIDVVVGAEAPGTSAVIFDGINSLMLLETLKRLSHVSQLRGLDLCEVNPTVDTSGRTEMLAAEALMTLLSPRVMNTVGPLDPEQLESVLLKKENTR